MQVRRLCVEADVHLSRQLLCSSTRHCVHAVTRGEARQGNQEDVGQVSFRLGSGMLETRKRTQGRAFHSRRENKNQKWSTAEMVFRDGSEKD